jgi:carbonic anhydrase
MRSLGLACAVKGGKEIAIIGHTDCQIGKTTTMDLIDRFRALGIERNLLPANVNEFFGMFASERANVLKAVDIARHSPLIGPKIPVHGLLLDIETGKVELLVNGYQGLDTVAARLNEVVASAGQTLDAMKSLTDFEIGGINFPDTKIGETVSKAEDWLSGKVHQLESKPPPAPIAPAAKPASPPRIPLPPPLRPKLRFHKGSK